MEMPVWHLSRDVEGAVRAGEFKGKLKAGGTIHCYLDNILRFEIKLGCKRRQLKGKRLLTGKDTQEFWKLNEESSVGSWERRAK